MKNNRGFTLIELLAVIVILAIILAIAIPGISGIINNSTKSSFKSDAKMILKAINYKQLGDDSFNPLMITKDNMQTLIGINSGNYAQVNFSIVSDEVKVILVGTGKWNGLTAYGTFKNMNVVKSEDYDEVPPAITILGDNPKTVKVGMTYVDAGATATDIKDGSVTVDAPVIRNASNQVVASVDTSVIGATYTITYTATDSGSNVATAIRTVEVIEGAYSVSKGVNKPVLTAGMTPIKWDGSAWIDTDATDTDWYNYTTGDKKWANARTADGSMWVWIPRYVYKISSGWHTATAGTIDIQFSMEADDTRGGTVTLDTGTTSNASNNKWTNHPAFTFGSTELMGIWVAKFEASGTTGAVDIKPGIAPLKNQAVGDMFTAARSLETNSRYGWGTTGADIDTHLIKNIEWGAVVYISQSTYGKNAEITINANSYTGGGSGTSYTTNGAQSSTGNIYGIYDLSGLTSEFVAAYMNNGNPGLSVGSVIVSADAKYKDAYQVTTDNEATNYANAINKKGDAIYETSSTATGSTSWYSDSSVTPLTSIPWFVRGGNNGSGAQAGAYSFAQHAPYVINGENALRPILVVGEGL